MSDQNGYIKDEELPKLTRTELIAKVRTARGLWRERDVEFEAMQAEIVDKDEQIQALTGQLVEVEALEQKLKVLESALVDRDEQIPALLHTLGEVEDINMNTLCRANHVAKILRPYAKPDSDPCGSSEPQGGQHQSAPSA